MNTQVSNCVQWHLNWAYVFLFSVSNPARSECNLVLPHGWLASEAVTSKGTSVRINGSEWYLRLTLDPKKTKMDGVRSTLLSLATAAWH